MFKIILDIASVDYNSLFENAMEMMKNNPDAAKKAGGKLPSKIEAFLFKRMSDEQKSTAIAEIVNKQQAEFIPQLEQAVSRYCRMNISGLEARACPAAGTTLRFYLDVFSADYDRAADLLTGAVLQPRNIPEALGSHYRAGLDASGARSVILSLPEDEKELVLLRILRIEQGAIFARLENAAAQANVQVRFQGARFLVPRR